MSPLKLLPVMKDYIWGGQKLKKYWNKTSTLDKIAESWELSLFHGCESTVAEGEYKGRTLASLVAEHPDIVGKKCACFDRFPVLIKLIDATGDLSIQVHPSDDYALKNERELGKTEMWYVADADEGAALYFGFNRDVSREEVEKAVKNNTVCELLNHVPVKRGDTLFVEAGTVHAILAGVTVIEIQESSSITYRLYDYDRRDKNGNPRELHVAKALDVLDYRKKDATLTAKPVVKGDGYTSRELCSCEYFRVSEIKVEKSYTMFASDSFVSFTVADGQGTLDSGTSVTKGDTVFVAAGERATLNGKITIIETTL